MLAYCYFFIVLQKSQINTINDIEDIKRKKYGGFFYTKSEKAFF